MIDCKKIGELIARLRKEKGLTQKNIADALDISHKTISKWECGNGCPDLSYLSELSLLLDVNLAQMLEGEIVSNRKDPGNIDKVRFYVCPTCGNILISTGHAEVFCCSRHLERLAPEDAENMPQVTVKEMDMDYYVTIDHPMTKDDYILFAAYVKNDTALLHRMYPEQNPEVRFPVMPKGKLYFYSKTKGLFLHKM